MIRNATIVQGKNLIAITAAAASTFANPPQPTQLTTLPAFPFTTPAQTLHAHASPASVDVVSYGLPACTDTDLLGNTLN